MLDFLNSVRSLLLGRHRKSLNDTQYVLKRDYTGSSRYEIDHIVSRPHLVADYVRLNLSFFLWKDLLRFNLHPDISQELSPNAQIADVATGTG
jgi:hypothetical protein